MSKPTRVPIPWSARWHHLRRQVLPTAVLIVCIGALAVIWRDLDGGGIPAIAEGVRTSVTCPQPALVEELKVRPYEWVEAGQLVAVLRPTDPRTTLNLLQSELQLARLRFQPSLTDENALDFERLRVESLRLKQALAVAEVELQRAEAALQRAGLLRKDKLVSEDSYDLSLRDRDRYKVEVIENRKALEEVDSRLAALRPIGEPATTDSNSPLRSLVAQFDARLVEAATNSGSIHLLAPISGMVHMVNRQVGEYAVEGEALITINSSKADRIVAYLRQPYIVEPEVGMKVEVSTRTRKRHKFAAEVTEVGAQVEVITNALAVVRPFAAVDVGLPVIVRVPNDISVRPGEVFDLQFRPDMDRNRRDAVAPVASR